MVFCVDKPIGISSNDAVQLIKRFGGFKKVGHAGTLDPEASGVLVIGTDESTKLLAKLLSDDKEYVVSVRFGVHTDTYDLSGFVTKYTGEVPDAALVKTTFSRFPAHYQQVPPAYSAIKVKGERAHAMMRQGREVVLAARDAYILDRELLSYKEGVLTFRLAVKKGFYVRSFAVDLAAAMNTLATVVALRRTRSGQYALAEAKSLSTFGHAPKARPAADPASVDQARDLLKAAQVERANEMLGSGYALTGKVVVGSGKARLLGYPTANLEHARDDCWAADGVYKSVTTYDGLRFRSVTFIGIGREDASGGHKFESHLFNFDGDLYGKTVSSALVRFIRANASFKDKQTLVAQIARDAVEAQGN